MIALVPALPLLSATALMVTTGRLPRRLVAWLGAGSVGLAALCTALVAAAYGDAGGPYTVHLWTWFAVGGLEPGIAFYVDGLALVMMSVITGVGFLIHLYSIEFMGEDASFSRYFAYMNLFVGAMLILVMADNLLLLYLGWEGVGLCSYLLVGFWYRDPANGAAARKAFVVTRVGDTAMILGLFLLFTQLHTLQIQPLMAAAADEWAGGGWLPTLAALLLLGGAVGKSAQLPLHTWLPDAMAGPTPVSALIHAATMVTAGVYLIARTHTLFLLSPAALGAVAWIGVLTLLLAACAALAQRDIKRILAYSTISQIGYMFLALGVGAFAPGVFHLVTHAFFKALLFLAAGAIIHCLHHEHDIFRMGGLRTRLPLVFWVFLIGAAALAALPFTAGFYSKDAILLSAWEADPWLWTGGLLGALLTGIYSFRLIFVVFFGEATHEPDRRPGWKMALPLSLLALLSLTGGAISLPLAPAFPVSTGHAVNHTVEYIGIAVPLLGLGIAYLFFLGRQLPVDALAGRGVGARLRRFWQRGWGFDTLYQVLWVTPYRALAHLLRGEPVDALYNLLAALCRQGHRGLAALQTGALRWYATTLTFALVVVIAIVLRGAM
nr:NADH-quinone oxidoreductase subunit L [Parahaliea mediterranea]